MHVIHVVRVRVRVRAMVRVRVRVRVRVTDIVECTQFSAEHFAFLAPGGPILVTIRANI